MQEEIRYGVQKHQFICIRVPHSNQFRVYDQPNQHRSSVVSELTVAFLMIDFILSIGKGAAIRRNCVSAYIPAVAIGILSAALPH